MAELLDPEGVWSEDLVRLMVPVAIEIQAEREESFFRAMGAVVSGLMSKEGPEQFQKAMGRVKDQVRQSQRRARGLDAVQEMGASKKPGVAGPDVAGQMLGLFKRMGMSVPRKRPPATGRKDDGKGRGPRGRR